MSVPADRATEVAALLELPFSPESPTALPRLKEEVRRCIRDYEVKLGGESPLEAMASEARVSLKAVHELVGLSADEQLCFAFVLMLATEADLERSAGCLGRELDDRAADAAIASALAMPVATVNGVFSQRGRLMSSRLLKRERNTQRLFSKFEWCTDSFPMEMRTSEFDPIRAMRDRVVPAPAPQVAWSRFGHMGELRTVMETYARQALTSRKTGVNFLLHGAPGTGKTEFTRALAKELGCALFEVSTEDSDGDPISGQARLRVLRLVQEFTAGRRAMVVFDEIEDVFSLRALMSPQSQSAVAKGWVNRILETNPTPTFWLTNAVDALDPAFVRRFEMVIEVKAPPLKDREAQIRALPLSLPPESVAKLAACTNLTAGVVQRAASVVQVVAAATPGLDVPRSIDLLVDQTLQAQGHGRLRAPFPSTGGFDPLCINSDVQPLQLLAGLRTQRSARICLYGPPGTGKTACAQWIARELGISLLLRRASDLLSPFVGMAEKLIAAAFQEAQDAGAVLLIDEVDSFLQDRTRARNGWEITQVNEFLTQLEHFDGLFLASTNLLDGFDPAAMRRFDLKAKFDYLRTEQSRRLLQVHLQAAGLGEATRAELARLDRCGTLTPGDFAVVARQHRFQPFRSPSDWVAGLEKECRHKQGAPRPPIGFGVSVAA